MQVTGIYKQTSDKLITSQKRYLSNTYILNTPNNYNSIEIEKYTYL